MLRIKWPDTFDKLQAEAENLAKVQGYDLQTVSPDCIGAPPEVEAESLRIAEQHAVEQTANAPNE